MNSDELECFIEFCKNKKIVNIKQIDLETIRQYRSSLKERDKMVIEPLTDKEERQSLLQLKEQLMQYNSMTVKKLVSECIKREEVIKDLRAQIILLEEEKRNIQIKDEESTYITNNNFPRDQEEYEELIDRCERAYLEEKQRVVKRCILEMSQYSNFYKGYMTSDDFISQLFLASLSGLQEQFLRVYPMEKYDGCTVEYGLYEIFIEVQNKDIYLDDFNQLENYIEAHKKSLKGIHYPIKNKLLEEIVQVARSQLKSEREERKAVREQLQQIKSTFELNDAMKFFESLKKLVDLGPKYIKSITEQEGFTLLFMAYIYDCNDFLEYKCINVSKWIKQDNIEATIYQKLGLFGSKGKIQKELDSVYRILTNQRNDILLVEPNIKEMVIERLLKVVKQRLETYAVNQ